MLKTLCNSFCRTRAWKQSRHFYSVNENAKLSILDTAKVNNENLLHDKNENDVRIENDESNGELMKQYLEELAATNVEPNRNENKLINDKINDDTEKPLKKKKTRKASLCIKPKFKMSEIPETVTALHVGPELIAWTRINSDFKVLDWNWYKWGNQKSQKFQPLDYIEHVQTTMKLLPKADAYVMEDMHIMKKHKHLEKMHSQKFMAVSLLSCVALREDISMPEQQKLYVLQSETTAHLFDLVVGHEVIAAHYVIKEILRATDDKPDTPCVDVNPEIRNAFSAVYSEQQEQISWSLLKALSFLRLVRAAIHEKSQ